MSCLAEKCLAVLLLVASCSNAKVHPAAADGAVAPPDVLGKLDGALLDPDEIVPPSPSTDGPAPPQPDARTSPFGQGCWTLGQLEPVSTANSPDWDGEAFLLPDGMTLYFSSNRPGAGADDVYVAFRPDRDAPFDQVVAVDAINTAQDEALAVAADGLTAFLATDRPGGPGGTDIWVATRASISIPWSSTLFKLDLTLSTAKNDYDPVPSPDGLRLYYALYDVSGGLGGQDVVVATRSAADDSFDVPTLIPNLSSSFHDSDPTLSPDERVIVFTSKRPGGSGGEDLWYAVRPDPSAPFSSPQPLPGVNTASGEGEAMISADGTELYFSSGRPGGQGGDDIYRVLILAGP